MKWENLLYFNNTDSCHHSEVPLANLLQPKDFEEQPWQESGLEVIVEELENWNWRIGGKWIGDDCGGLEDWWIGGDCGGKPERSDAEVGSRPAFVESR